jgi:hypothetical protein
MRTILISFFAFGANFLPAQKTETLPAQWINRLSGHYAQGINGIALSPNNEISYIGVAENRGNVHYYQGKKLVDSTRFQPIQYKNPTRMLLGRYDSTGKLLWHLESEGPGNLHAWNIANDAAGNILVVGNFTGEVLLPGTGGSGSWMRDSTFTNSYTRMHVYCSFVAKYDPRGRLLWYKTSISKDHSVMQAVRCDREGNVYVKAYAHANSIAFDRHTLLTGTGSGYVYNYSIILIKYTASGNEEWVFYGGSSNARFFDLDSAGNPFITIFHQEKFKCWNTDGAAYEIPQRSKELGYTLLYIDRKDGSLLRYDSLGLDLKDASIEDIKPAPDGGRFCLTMAYPTESYGRNFKMQAGGKTYLTRWYDYFLIRFDARGKLQWLAKVSGVNDDRPLDLHVDSMGNTILTGWFTQSATVYDAQGDSAQATTQFRSLWICAFDTLGKLRWQQTAGNWTHSIEKPVSNLLVNSHGRLHFFVNYNAPAAYGQDSLVPYGKENWQSRRHGAQYVIYDGFDGALFSVRQPDRDTLPKRDSIPLLAVVNDSLKLVVNTPPVGLDTAITRKMPETSTAAVPVLLRLFPIPVSKSEARIYLNLSAGAGMQLTLEVSDANGRVVFRESQQLSSSRLERSYDISAWAPGTYYFRYVLDGQLMLRKVLIL